MGTVRGVQSWEEPDLGLTRDSKAEAAMGVGAGVGAGVGGAQEEVLVQGQLVLGSRPSLEQGCSHPRRPLGAAEGGVPSVPGHL